MTSRFHVEDTGVTNEAEQEMTTVIANASGDTCSVCAASMATGAINRVVAAFERNSPISAAAPNTTISMAVGPAEPNAATSPLAITAVIPVLFSAVASGIIPATSTTVFQLTTR